jgi:hypothetical protein
VTAHDAKAVRKHGQPALDVLRRDEPWRGQRSEDQRSGCRCNPGACGPLAGAGSSVTDDEAGPPEHRPTGKGRTRWRRKRARSRSARTVGPGSRMAGTRSRRESSANTDESMRSVLRASGASPSTFLASATSTDQPQGSKVSWRNRAPFIDSMTASTSSAAWSLLVGRGPGTFIQNSLTRENVFEHS